MHKDKDCKNHTNTCNAQTTVEYAQPDECAGFQKAKSSFFAFLDFESLIKNYTNNDPHQIATYKYILVNIIDKQNLQIAKKKKKKKIPFDDDCVNNCVKQPYY